MKKVSLFLALSFVLSNSVFALDATPLQLDPVGQGTFIEVQQDTSDLINVDNMKKSERIKEMSEKTKDERKAPKIKLDSRAIDHQRALNFMQHQTNINTTLPSF